MQINDGEDCFEEGSDMQADKSKAEKTVDPVEAELKKYSIITSNPWEPEKP